MPWLRQRLNTPLVAGVAIFVVATSAAPAGVLGPKQWGQRAPIASLSECLRFTTLLRQLANAPTLLLRTLTVWLPMLPGVWLARREIHLH